MTATASPVPGRGARPRCPEGRRPGCVLGRHPVGPRPSRWLTSRCRPSRACSTRPTRTVAWTMTAYTLALATVIPLTGWAADRFGTKRLYLLSLVLFVARLRAVRLAWDIGSLISFRVLQGLGGGMLMPLGMTIMTRAAGPRPDRPRDGRARRADAARPDRRPDPRWLAHRGGQLALDLPDQRADRHRRADRSRLRVLPKDDPHPSESFDFLGMLLLSPGLALFLYGVSSIPERGHGRGRPRSSIPALIGLRPGGRVRAATRCARTTR